MTWLSLIHVFTVLNNYMKIISLCDWFEAIKSSQVSINKIEKIKTQL